MSVLAIDGLGIRYGERLAIRDVSLSVAAGEIVGLVGESGSGKSTVALAATGLLPDTATLAGAVTLAGVDLATLTERQRDGMRGSAVGLVTQEPMSALNPVFTIGGQVAEAIRLHRPLGRRAALREAERLLAEVGLPPDVAPPSRYPHQLSGGQRQRVAIAIALAGDPQLIVADEPTTALDVTTQARILALLKALVRDRGKALLLVSHDLGVIGEVADRVLVMHGGTIVEAGSTAAVFARPQHSYTRMLLEKARATPARHPTIDERKPILEVRGLSHRYPGAARAALTDIGFTLHAGETLGVIGESGSGKTTLLRAVLGLDREAGGAVLLGGQPIATSRGAALRQLRRQVQAVFQDPRSSFDPRQSVERIVAEPLHLLDRPVDRAERRARVEKVLQDVGLQPGDADRLPHQFSGGQRQRIAIARALILEPALITLDEAVSALDVSVRADILALLADLGARRGIAYLFVSHDLTVMKAVTDRLLVIKDGRIVEQGPTAAVLRAPSHPYTAALVAATPDLNAMIERYSRAS